ncbi:MAG: hypothetical protein LBO04_01245, partial [Spirochaetaceae bacterium]|nr:hypothetical protein [Spirochaetaceae bacterium]
MVKYSGLKALIYMSGLDYTQAIDGTGSNKTAPDQLYLITKKAQDSDLPMPAFSLFFSPYAAGAENQITLKTGDQIIPL